MHKFTSELDYEMVQKLPEIALKRHEKDFKYHLNDILVMSQTVPCDHIV